MKEYVITFESTHHAIKFEKTIQKIVDYEVLPTPREISSSCGISIKISDVELGKVCSIADFDGQIVYETQMSLEGVKQYKKIDGEGLCH